MGFRTWAKIPVVTRVEVSCLSPCKNIPNKALCANPISIKPNINMMMNNIILMLNGIEFAGSVENFKIKESKNHISENAKIEIICSKWA